MPSTPTCEPPPWRVVIIDDQTLLTSALQIAFQHDGRATVVATAERIEQGLATVRATSPDVVLTDRRLPDGDVEEHVEALRTASPSARVLMMTGWPTERSSLRALEAGVHGIVSKAEPIERIIDAVDRVMSGDLVIPASLGARLATQARLGGHRGSKGDLTARELDVLDALAHGESITVAAERLCISRNTARNHLAHVMFKLGVHDRVAAVTEGIRQGLVSPEMPPALEAVAAGSGPAH